MFVLSNLDELMGDCLVTVASAGLFCTIWLGSPTLNPDETGQTDVQSAAIARGGFMASYGHRSLVSPRIKVTVGS